MLCVLCVMFIARTTKLFGRHCLAQIRLRVRMDGFTRIDPADAWAYHRQKEQPR